jgi:dipeptidyl aminopeptidase/acylaminoacyl peptidase
VRTRPPGFPFSSFVVATWLSICICGTYAAKAQSPAVPLDVYGRLPSLEDVIVSPDGGKIAYVKTHGDDRNLGVVALGQPALLGGVRIGDSKLRSVSWIDNDRLLIMISDTVLPVFASERAGEFGHLLTYDVKKSSLRALSFKISDDKTFDLVAGQPSVRIVDGEAALFVPGWVVRDRAVVPALYAFSGDHARLVDTSRRPSRWLLDESGRIAAQTVYDNDKKKWEIRIHNADGMTVAASGTAALDIPEIMGFSAAGDAIIVQFFENGDPVWKPLFLKDKSWGAPLDSGASFDRVIADRNTGRIVGGIRNVSDGKYVFFDNELQAHWNAILRAFPGERVQLTSHSDDYSKAVVKVFGAKDGYAYALYDWYNHQATIIGQVYDGLGGPAEVRAITYSAADGLTIPGLLTLPRGIHEKSLPLVVLPHGGPAAADIQDFDWWAQALAAEGYAVLQPNYRGSTLSYKYEASGFGEWGRKMQTDLSDGVRYLAKQGTIDPKRVCIVGASYGGYAALAGVSLDLGVYRCAVSVAGISDLKLFRRGTFTGSSNLPQRYWDRFMGAAYQNDPALRAISPIEHVSSVAAPVLLIHGRGDGVVPYEQSEVMLNALKRAGKSVELVTLGNEDHWLSHGQTRLQMLQACVAFLIVNNPPN